MALVLGDNFSYGGSKPLDARLKYNTIADMKAVADATMYDGCLAYCSGTDKTYQWKSTNTVDESTGRWREFSSGGGGGTEYTAGDGIVIDDDEISVAKSVEGDMDEIIDELPVKGNLISIANAFNRADLYSTDEKMIGQWTDGKPLYQKTFSGTTPSTVNTSTDFASGLSSLNIEDIIAVDGYLIKPETSTNNTYRRANSLGWSVWANRTAIRQTQSDGSYLNLTAYVILTYTKTTDTAISIGSETEYSTDEKVVGTWIDGKPIFQKTIETTTPTCTAQGTQVEKFVAIGEEVDQFISVEGFFRIPNTADMPLNSVFKANSTITYSLVRGNPNIAASNPNTIYISVSNTNWSARTCYVTFQYTKVTT